MYAKILRDSEMIKIISSLSSRLLSMLSVLPTVSMSYDLHFGHGQLLISKSCMTTQSMPVLTGWK